MSIENPEKSLIESIVHSENSIDLFNQLGEVGIDTLLNAGVLRDIPILGTAISLFKAGNEIPAFILTKKIATFLSEVEKIDINQRQYLLDKIDSENGQDKIGESLLLLIDKLDNYALVKMLGKAFRLLLTGEIVKGTYEIYIHAIKQLNPYLLRQLHGVYQAENLMTYDASCEIALASCGLIKINISSAIGGGNMYVEKTAIGKEFYNKIIKDILN